MNWEAIGAVGEILGVLGVIATLAYLAIQVRQNTRTAQSSIRQAISECSQNAATDIVTNEEIASIMLRGLKGEELNEVEALRLQARCYRDMQHWENIFYQMREGTVCTR